MNNPIEPGNSSKILSPRQEHTLSVICETFLPSLIPESGDNPELFALSANHIVVSEPMHEALSRLDVTQQRELRLLLTLLEQPLLSAILIGRLKGLGALSHADRERLMQAMATSRLAMLRTGYQAFKRLSVFIFYSLTDEKGKNATWPAIGFIPSSNPPSAPASLKITPIMQPTTLECDLCVIGSGAGGGVVAGEAAMAGKKVIVLEAAAPFQAPDYDQKELIGWQRLILDEGLLASHDLSIAILGGAALGGGTAINWQTSLQLPPDVRAEWAELSGYSFFADEEFTRSIEAVLSRLNVGTSESIVNSNNNVLKRGCEMLGYEWTTLPRNAKGCDTAQCGDCTFGCRHGGKQSTATTYLCDAQTQGDTTIIASCRAERILTSNGKVQGAEATYTDPTTGVKRSVTVKAPAVAMAAGAVYTPVIMLRSGLGHAMLGRNLFLHPTTAVIGNYGERIEPWSGPPQTILSTQFSRLSGLYGVSLEVAPAFPGLSAIAIPWFGPADHRRRMQHIGNQAAIITLSRDRLGGKVSLRKSGRPVIHYQPTAENRAHIQRGMQEAARIHLAAGAHSVLTLHTRKQELVRTSSTSETDIDRYCAQLAIQAASDNWLGLFSAHQMGTCRMGSDSRTAVCNANGEVYGMKGLFVVDGSAFPASSGVNPMITIMALAHHTAQYIKAM